ncbi:hypothetical protein IAI10_06150 [Clostridium sp. 19966]|uniref:hypothetical protein n=1 Tax=Clostridium sp. 19966 TaxID=2768166 RepID=UPI0028E09E00|nr:hypothetical protein [Clostridium sp. 19966]MDT8716232.1 hypothetical protein [Clostridium sp. 19966]
MSITNESLDDFKLLSVWINRVLEQELPKGIKAFNFNIYEGEEETYDIQLIGSDNWDKESSDWACTDYFTTGEDICYIEKNNDIDDWELGLNYVIEMITRYLEEGKNSYILKSVYAIGVGFVDGDINIIYERY